MARRLVESGDFHGFPSREPLNSSLKLNEDWKKWDWDLLKREYSSCQQTTQVCQKPMKAFGSFRERFMRHAFCCSRRLQTPDDPNCSSSLV